MASAMKETITQACAGLSRSILHQYKNDAALSSVLAAVRNAPPSLPRAPVQNAENEGDNDDGWCSLYPSKYRQPYVAYAAKGPWIGTTEGGVLYDVGGYGMLGWGHNPCFLKGVLSSDHVQANIMTPSVHQQEFMRVLRSHIAPGRPQPYKSFVALNSGSEGVTFALRMSRVGHRDKPEAFVRMSKSFHGRTDMPALMSASSDASYRKNIGGWGEAAPRVETIEYNDVDGVEKTFARLHDEGFAVRAAIAEPVQGEGAPGLPMSREFYSALREASSAHGAALIIDSVQAGIRAQGCLSIVDYPTLAGLAPPDMEVFSKAIHGGQYPLSLVAMGPSVSYPGGIYGSTMTANPRALAVGTEVLKKLTPEFQLHVRRQGDNFKAALTSLWEKYPSVVSGVSGTGLLCAMDLNEKYDVLAVEKQCRMRGLNVIHGGKNALRFTPCFTITEEDIEKVIVPVLDDVLASNM